MEDKQREMKEFPSHFFGNNFLACPGPTPVPDRIRRAMLVPAEDHRSPIHGRIVREINPMLKKIFNAEKTGTPIIWPAATGTGAWESGLVNTLSMGDKVLAFSFGQFSANWCAMAVKLGLDAEIHELPLGTGPDPSFIESRLRKNKKEKKEIKAILVVHNETTAGVTTDIGAVRRAMDAAHHSALLHVDCVSSVPSLNFQFDDWKVDVLVTGSQKGFMMPAGLSINCASERAIECSKGKTIPHYFLGWTKNLAMSKDGYFPYTPSVPMLYGLRESCAMLLEEGPVNTHARHARLAESVRQAVKAWGLRVCCKNPAQNSNTVTCIMVPAGVDARNIIRTAFRKYNVSLGGGLMSLAGKAFRIGHLGYVNETMILGVLSSVEMAMKENGVNVTLGSGVGAAQKYLASTLESLNYEKNLPTSKL
eukprot:m.13017 g.13017  ORF g.13017 m.13017 type:complete len:421 (+) comp4771_c0_seq1:143-1405(+)